MRRESLEDRKISGESEVVGKYVTAFCWNCVYRGSEDDNYICVCEARIM